MSRWIEHVKEFAKKNNMSYGCALSDPNLKKGYVPAGDKKRKPEKLEMATPSTEPKPKNIVIKQHEVIPLQQAMPSTEPVAKNIVIKPRPLASTLSAYDLLRKLLLQPRGIGTAMLLQKGIIDMKKEWIDGTLKKDKVITILELTKKQSVLIDKKPDAYVDVEAVGKNQKEIDSLLSAIGGEGIIEFYHAGGPGVAQSFRIRMRGSAKEKKDALLGVAKWLDQIPTPSAIYDLYSKEFKSQAKELRAGEASEKTSSREKLATEWLGHPLTEIDYKDVVKSIKATLKKFGSTIKGITTLYKNYDTAPLLISRAYEVFKTFTEKKDEHVAEFRRLLLDKGFWNENIKRLPADLGAHVASFLNLPKGLMKDIIDRRNNK